MFVHGHFNLVEKNIGADMEGFDAHGRLPGWNDVMVGEDEVQPR